MENIIGNIVFILIILFTHMFVYNTQNMTSKNYFYGVYVKNIELGNELKTKIDRTFKKRLNRMLLLVIILFLLINYLDIINFGLNIVIFVMIYTIFSFFYLKKSYDEVKHIKIEFEENQILEIDNKTSIKKTLEIDTELIKQKAKLKKKFRILFGVCICLSLLSFLYVLINYKGLPDVIITHWNGKGQPDGYSSKSIISVFSINIIDIAIVLLFAVMGVESIGSKTYIDMDNLEVNRKKAVKYLNGIGYSYLLLTLSIQSITTTIPVFMVKQLNIPIWLTLFSVIAPILVVIPLIYYYIMLDSLKPKKKSNYSIVYDDEKWLYGFIYYNKEDPSFMVEKRYGAGWSINMANKKGQLLTIILFIITFGSLALPFIM